jgi:hypothetical protein
MKTLERGGKGVRQTEDVVAINHHPRISIPPRFTMETSIQYRDRLISNQAYTSNVVLCYDSEESEEKLCALLVLQMLRREMFGEEAS